MNFTYWSLLIAALLPYIPLPLARGKHINNQNPRAGYAKGSAYQQRAYAAHQNGFEAFGFYAIAVIVATQAGGNPLYINILAALWVLLRIVIRSLTSRIGINPARLSSPPRCSPIS